MHYIVALLGVTASTTTSPQGPAQSRPLAEVTFTLHQNAVIVPAVVNGRDTVHLLLDTGWGPLALVFTSAQRLGLVVDAPDADGLGRAQVASLAIGDVNRSRPLVEVFPTEALAPLIGPHDGVLSTAFFRDLVLQIDYPARVVRFFRRSPIPSTPSASRTSVPMVFSPQAGACPPIRFQDALPVRGPSDTRAAFVAMGQLVELADCALPKAAAPARHAEWRQMVQQRR
jgi:hypothetical protein